MPELGSAPNEANDGAARQFLRDEFHQLVGSLGRKIRLEAELPQSVEGAVAELRSEIWRGKPRRELAGMGGLPAQQRGANGIPVVAGGHGDMELSKRRGGQD